MNPMLERCFRAQATIPRGLGIPEESLGYIRTFPRDIDGKYGLIKHLMWGSQRAGRDWISIKEDLFW